MTDPVEGEINASVDRNASQVPSPMAPPIEGQGTDGGSDGPPSLNTVSNGKDNPKHWTKYAEAICAIALVFITAYYAYNASKQAGAAIAAAKAAESAANTAREEMELSQRPWLVVKATIASPLTYDKEGGHIMLHYAIVNVGHNPAIGVNIWPEFYVANGKKADPIIERRRLCKELEARQSGETIYPGQPFEINEQFSMSRADIDESTRAFGYAILLTSVVDCVNYHSNFSNQPYSVGDSYDLRAAAPDGTTRDFAPYVDMPLGSLVLIPEAFDPTDAR